MGCLCGCKTLLLHGQDLSKLSSIPLEEMFISGFEFLDLII